MSSLIQRPGKLGFADAAGVVGGRRATEPSMNTTDLAPGKSGGLYGTADCIPLETLKYPSYLGHTKSKTKVGWATLSP